MGDSRNTSGAVTCTCHDDGEVLDQRDCPVHDPSEDYVCHGCGTVYDNADEAMRCAWTDLL